MALLMRLYLFIESLIRWDLSGKRVGAVSVTLSPVALSSPWSAWIPCEPCSTCCVIFSQKSKLLIYNTFMPSCNCPSLRSQQGTIRPPPRGANPQGKNRYLSLYIDVGMCVYMYRTTTAIPHQFLRRGLGHCRSQSRAPAGLCLKRLSRAGSKERFGSALPATVCSLFPGGS